MHNFSHLKGLIKHQPFKTITRFLFNWVTREILRTGFFSAATIKDKNKPSII